MKIGWLAAIGAAVLLGAVPAAAQTIPKTRAEVARPGGTIPGAPKLALVKVADGFQDPVGVAVANDGSGRIFVVERAGRVRIVKDGKALPDPFLDLTNFNPLGTDVQTGFVEQGLWSIAFHPKFKENGHFFVHYASLPFNGASLVVRFTVDPKSPDALSPEQVSKTAKVLMNIPQPYYNHYGGMIAFGPDGKLYIGKGDGGWEGDPLNAGQRLDVHWGKLLRIDVDTPDDVPYAVPKDNPLAQANKPQLMSLFGISELEFSKIHINAKPEIWAYGLRNPYTFHFDRKSGDLFIADVGQNHWEEVDWQPASSKGGENYGWKLNQGSHCFPTTGPEDNCPIVGVLPVAECPHDEPYPGAPKLREGTGCSIEGLGVANYGGLEKTYLVGDWCSGRLWGIAWDKGANRWQMQEFMQTALQFTAGQNDEDGTVLAVNCYCFYTEDRGPAANPPGALWRVLPADKVPSGAEVAQVKAGPTPARSGGEPGVQPAPAAAPSAPAPAAPATPRLHRSPSRRRGDGLDRPSPRAAPGRPSPRRIIFKEQPVMRRWWLWTGAALAVWGGAALAEEIVFKHVLTDAPLDAKPCSGEVETEAVERFKQTGEAPYRGDEQALAEGKKLYAVNCQACHLPDGSGRIGPSLVGDNWVHQRSATDVGMFEIIYGGASGAMQSYAKRCVTQDQMLKIIAYVRSLKKA